MKRNPNVNPGAAGEVIAPNLIALLRDIISHPIGVEYLSMLPVHLGCLGIDSECRAFAEGQPLLLGQLAWSRSHAQRTESQTALELSGVMRLPAPLEFPLHGFGPIVAHVVSASFASQRVFTVWLAKTLFQ